MVVGWKFIPESFSDFEGKLEYIILWVFQVDIFILENRGLKEGYCGMRDTVQDLDFVWSICNMNKSHVICLFQFNAQYFKLIFISCISNNKSIGGLSNTQSSWTLPLFFFSNNGYFYHFLQISAGPKKWFILIGSQLHWFFFGSHLIVANYMLSIIGHNVSWSDLYNLSEIFYVLLAECL